MRRGTRDVSREEAPDTCADEHRRTHCDPDAISSPLSAEMAVPQRISAVLE
jgi:hypothetical protein